MLTRLYAHNYRCFINFELTPARSGILLGYNGSGKSSVFDVLIGLVQLLHWNKDASDAFPGDTVTRFGDSADQRFELDVTSAWGGMRYVLVVTHDLDQGTCRIASEEVTLDGKPLYRFKDAEVQLYRDDHTPARDTFSYTPKRSFLASLEAKPVNRRLTWFKNFIGGIWVLGLNPRRMAAVSTADDDVLDVDGGNFASWCRHLLQDAPEHMEQATTALRQIMPGFQRLRMQLAGRSRVLVATFQVPGGKAYDLDFEALSDGQKVLIVLYAVLHAVGGSAALLCLDEPDNFVSIREIQPFLIELANLTEDQGVQTLLISHSGEVINFFGPEGALLLERPEGGPTRVGRLSHERALSLSELMARGWHLPVEGGDAG